MSDYEIKDYEYSLIKKSIDPNKIMPTQKKIKSVLNSVTRTKETTINLLQAEQGLSKSQVKSLLSAKIKSDNIDRLAIQFGIDPQNLPKVKRQLNSYLKAVAYMFGVIFEPLDRFLYGRLGKQLSANPYLQKLLQDNDLSYLQNMSMAKAHEILFSGTFDVHRNVPIMAYLLTYAPIQALSEAQDSPGGITGGEKYDKYRPYFFGAIDELKKELEGKSYTKQQLFDKMKQDEKLKQSGYPFNEEIFLEIYDWFFGRSTTSIDVFTDDEGKKTLKDKLQDSSENEEKTLSRLEIGESYKQIGNAVAQLEPLQRTVLMMRLGFEVEDIPRSSDAAQEWQPQVAMNPNIPKTREEVLSILQEKGYEISVRDIQTMEKEAIKQIRSGGGITAKLFGRLMAYAARWSDEAERKIRQHYILEKGRGRDSKYISEELSRILAKEPYGYVDDEGNPTKSPHAIHLKLNRMSREDDELKSFQYKRWESPGEVIQELRKIYLGLNKSDEAEEISGLPGEVPMSMYSNPKEGQDTQMNRYFLSKYYPALEAQIVRHSKPRCEEVGAECWWNDYYEPILQAINQAKGGNPEEIAKDFDFDGDENARQRYIDFKIKRRKNWDKEAILDVLKKTHKAGYPVSAQFFAKFPSAYKKKLNINRSLEGFRYKVPEVFGSWKEALIASGAIQEEHYDEIKKDSVEERVVEKFLEVNNIPYKRCALSEKIEVEDPEILALGYKHFVPDFFILKGGKEWIPIEVFGDIQDRKQSVQGSMTVGALYKEKRRAKINFYSKNYDDFIYIDTHDMQCNDLDSFLIGKFANYLNLKEEPLTKEAVEENIDEKNNDSFNDRMDNVRVASEDRSRTDKRARQENTIRKPLSSIQVLGNFGKNETIVQKIAYNNSGDMVFEAFPQDSLSNVYAGSSSELIQDTLNLYLDIHTASRGGLSKRANTDNNEQNYDYHIKEYEDRPEAEKSFIDIYKHIHLYQAQMLKQRPSSSQSGYLSDEANMQYLQSKSYLLEIIPNYLIKTLESLESMFEDNIDILRSCLDEMKDNFDDFREEYEKPNFSDKEISEYINDNIRSDVKVYDCSFQNFDVGQQQIKDWYKDWKEEIDQATKKQNVNDYILLFHKVVNILHSHNVLAQGVWEFWPEGDSGDVWESTLPDALSNDVPDISLVNMPEYRQYVNDFHKKLREMNPDMNYYNSEEYKNEQKKYQKKIHEWKMLDHKPELKNYWTKRKDWQIRANRKLSKRAMKFPCPDCGHRVSSADDFVEEDPAELVCPNCERRMRLDPDHPIGKKYEYKVSDESATSKDDMSDTQITSASLKVASNNYYYAATTSEQVGYEFVPDSAQPGGRASSRALDRIGDLIVTGDKFYLFENEQEATKEARKLQENIGGAPMILVLDYLNKIKIDRDGSPYLDMIKKEYILDIRNAEPYLREDPNRRETSYMGYW